MQISIERRDQLLADIDGPHGDKFIWTDEDVADYAGFTTPKTVIKNRSQRIGPIGEISWRRFGRGMRCKPRELAEAFERADQS